MKAIKIIGLDIAKSVFQVHGIDAEGQVVVRQQLRDFVAFCKLSLQQLHPPRRQLYAFFRLLRLLVREHPDVRRDTDIPTTDVEQYAITDAEGGRSR